MVGKQSHHIWTRFLARRAFGSRNSTLLKFAASRASTMTGRYPFNVGFYGDGVAPLTNYTTTAELLRQQVQHVGDWQMGCGLRR